eukprot:COSAG05_NODE_27664_length_147_cov_61.375000_1_plen_36_part_01
MLYKVIRSSQTKDKSKARRGGATELTQLLLSHRCKT